MRSVLATRVDRIGILEPLAVQNEKRKDKEVTERIEKLLKRREEVTKGVDLGTRHRGVSRLSGY
jgi:hypothetical protein